MRHAVPSTRFGPPPWLVGALRWTRQLQPDFALTRGWRTPLDLALPPPGPERVRLYRLRWSGDRAVERLPHDGTGH